MATGVVDQIRTPHVKKWYEENTKPGFLAEVNKYALGRGYVLDPESGLFFRSLPSYYKDNYLVTILDGIFPRPVDLHHHLDVDEVITVIAGWGRGVKMADGECSDAEPKEYSLVRGSIMYVPSRTNHSFAPQEEKVLEMHLVCSGVLNPEDEVCVKRFDEYGYWKVRETAGKRKKRKP